MAEEWLREEMSREMRQFNLEGHFNVELKGGFEKEYLLFSLNKSDFC